MYFLALAADYDGTLALNGVVDAVTLEALWRLKNTGRRLILVTGRELPELKQLFPGIALFDRVVAENGALIHDPATGQERLVGLPPSVELVQRLQAMNVSPLSVGRSVVATWEPHQATVLNVIRDLGLELQIVFNKGAVMILPPGVNKATGLLAALDELDLSAHNVAAIGDAENDHAFMRTCGLAAAVANALPAVKAEADIALVGDHGAGVIELIEQIIGRDAAIAPKARHGILVGFDRLGNEVHLEPYGGSVLIAGPSGSGKSTLATALTERMAEKQFEFCVIDPEGDYIELQRSVCIGGIKTPPALADALELLRDSEANLVINTQALPLGARRKLFAALLRETSRLRATSGRPHWLVIDEAHQAMPASHAASPAVPSGDEPAGILITVHPGALAVAALETVDVILAFGDAPAETFAAFGTALGISVPTDLPVPGDGEIIFWARGSAQPPLAVRYARPVQTHRRHAGKYAVGDVGAHRSFYFRGPDNAMNTPARNLFEFLDIGFAIDDAAWEHHLRAGQYSAWFRHVIKDEELADETARIEADGTLDAAESRRLIRKAIWRRYTMPSEAH